MAARPGDLGEGLRGQPTGGPEPLQPLLVTANRGRDVETRRDVQVGFDLSGEVACTDRIPRQTKPEKPQPCMRYLPGQGTGPDNQSCVGLRSLCPHSAAGSFLNGLPVGDWSHACHLFARLT
jgi:hypothetical protein